MLIRGETGTGKEVVAWAITKRIIVRRKLRGYRLLAIPKNLIESELYGHEKGAFTGAVSQRKGAFSRRWRHPVFGRIG